MASEGDTDCSTASVDISASSGTSNDFGDCSVTSKKEQKAAKKLGQHMLRTTEKQRKKKQKNKITKADFQEKSLEFKTWIAECKRLNPELMSPKRSKELFKKFVKKWNKKKLPEQYYRGVDVLWASLGSPKTIAGWTLPAIQLTPSVPSEEKLLYQYSRTPTEDAGFSTFGRRKGKKLMERMRECQRRHGEGSVEEIVTKSDPKTHIYAEPLSPEQREALRTIQQNWRLSNRSLHSVYEEPSLDDGIPVQFTPEYCSVRQRRPENLATISRPWACSRSSKSLSIYSDASDLDSLNYSSMSSISRFSSIPCIPEIPSLSCSAIEDSEINETLVEEKFGSHDKLDGDMKTDMLNTGKKSMSKQDSYISNIENTSYVLFERKSADQNSWVQRKPPPPKPPRTSSVKKMAPLPPPPPTLHFPSPPPSPMDFPSPPPPLTTSSTSLRSAISPLAGEDGYCPMNKQPKRNRPESIPEDEYVYAVPCDVNMEKVKKKKKKTSDSPKAKGLVKPHGKKLPQVPSNESLSSELTKRAAPPVPAKPSHLSKPELAKVRSSEVYANVLSEALSLETPMKGAQSSSEGPVLLRTPAGMFLVTKLNGPLAEVSHC